MYGDRFSFLLLRAILAVLLVTGVGPVALAASGSADVLRLQTVPFLPDASGDGFLARGPAWTVHFEAGGPRLFPSTGLSAKLQFHSADPSVLPQGLERGPGHTAYFVGDSANWKSSLANYNSIVYRSLYPGIDAIYRWSEGLLKAEFTVQPGVDPSVIRWSYAGGNCSIAGTNRRLVCETPAGTVEEAPPIAFQAAPGGRREVSAEYLIDADGRAGFRLGLYDTSLPLVIDPAVRYSTYLGGSGQDWVESVAVDTAGNTYVAGYTTSPNFPNASQPISRSTGDAFILKFSASHQLVYAIYVGGSREDRALAIRADAAGNAYVGGWTVSSDFPGGVLQGPRDGFVIKIPPSGNSISSAVLIGGSRSDEITSLAVDASGQLYAGGKTDSTDLSLSGGFQPALKGGEDGFLIRMASSGLTIQGGTYLGGVGQDWIRSIALDSSGGIVFGGVTKSTDLPVTSSAFQTSSGGGFDGFGGVLDATTFALRYLTYLGGSATLTDQVTSVTTDSQGNAIFVGSTSSPNFPVRQAFQTSPNGLLNTFVVKANPQGTVIYSTYFGSGSTDARAVTTDPLGNIWFGGVASTSTLPVVSPIQAQPRGEEEGFLARLSADGKTLNFSTYLGGSLYDVITSLTWHPAGYIVAGGYSGSLDWPVSSQNFQNAAGGSTDGFVVEIDPAGVNNAPQAVADAAETLLNQSVVIAVLANDSDPDGDALTLQTTTNGLHGTVTRTANNTVTYLPETGFLGTDQFTYLVGDNRFGLASAIVTVTVRLPLTQNQQPVSRNDSASTLVGSSINTMVLANDSDPDGDPLIVTYLTQPSQGTALINPDYSIRYIPRPGFQGSDSYTYTISDGRGGSSTATVTITVQPAANTAPVAGNDAASTMQGIGVNVLVLANDSDVDQDALTVVSATQGASGSVIVNPDRTIRYTPAPTFIGTDSFDYTIADGRGGQATGRVTVTVNTSGNQPPTAAPDSATTNTGAGVNINVLTNDSDPEGDPLLVISVTQALSGSVQVNPDRTVRYLPNPGFSGQDSFSYTVSDGRGGQAIATVSVRVEAAANQPPTARDDAATTTAGTGVTILVLANDTDPDQDPLSLGILANPAHGAVLLNPDRTIRYTPVAGFTGSDSFIYRANDGRGGFSDGTVTVTVTTSGNKAPVSNDDTASTLKGTAVNIQVLSNDMDPDGDPLYVASTTQGARGVVVINADRTVRYTPASGFTGVDIFSYTAADGRGGQSVATVSVTVSGSGNTPPIATNDLASTVKGSGVNVLVLANDIDGDQDPLTVTAIGQALHGVASMNADQSIRYTPAAEFVGTDQFAYTISDGRGDQASATVTVTVNPAGNSLPVARDDTARTTQGVAVNIQVLMNDSDSDGDPLRVVNATQGVRGSVSINPDSTIRYLQNGSFSGEDSFRYTVSDGRGGEAVAMVFVTIDPAVNRAPIAVADSATTVAGAAVNVQVLLNDIDPDNDPLRITSATQGAKGSVAVNSDQQSVRYIPNPGTTGVDTFTYTISDGRGASATANVTMTLTSTGNRAPVAVEDSASTTQDSPVNVQVLANDSDPDSDPLHVAAVTQGTKGSVLINTDQLTVRYTPVSGASGADSFTYTVSDGRGGTASAAVNVTIAQSGNRPPIATNDVMTTTQNSDVNVLVLLNDSDPDSDPLHVSSVTQGAKGSVSINADQRSIRYSPINGATGADSFTYTASDGRGGAGTATVSITITQSSNQSPIAASDTVTTSQDSPVNILVLANDSDPDGDPLHVESVSPGAKGVVIVNADRNSVRYTPNAGATGADTFSYTVADSLGAIATGTVSVTIVAIQSSQPPVAANDQASTVGGAAIDIAVLRNDSDPDGDPLTLVSVGAGIGGNVTALPSGMVRYFPRSDFSGSDTFSYTITDGKGGTAVGSVRVTVTQSNNGSYKANSFVQKAYEDFQGRAPSGQELSFWKTALETGQTTRVELIRTLFEDEGFQARAPERIRTFLTVQGRVPDGGAWKYLQSPQGASTTGSSLARALIYGPHFRKQWGRTSDERFVGIVLSNALGRIPDAAKVAQWLGQLNGQTRHELVEDLVDSADVEIGDDARVTLEILCLSLLQRPCDAATRSFWQAQFGDGAQLEEAISSIITSQDYMSRFGQ